MDLTTAAADLLLGAACSGCGRPAVGLCGRCVVDIAPRPGVVRTEPVEVSASGEHADILRLAIVAWKMVDPPGANGEQELRSGALIAGTFAIVLFTCATGVASAPLRRKVPQRTYQAPPPPPAYGSSVP